VRRVSGDFTDLYRDRQTRRSQPLPEKNGDSFKLSVPRKSWRAKHPSGPVLDQPRRSRSACWSARASFLFVPDRAVGLQATFGLPAFIGPIAKYVAIAAGLVVACYQGMAMAASESFTLWASPLVPASSLCYAATAGTLMVLVIGWEGRPPRGRWRAGAPGPRGWVPVHRRDRRRALPHRHDGGLCRPARRGAHPPDRHEPFGRASSQCRD
jgi:hypothetical protein